MNNSHELMMNKPMQPLALQPRSIVQTYQESNQFCGHQPRGIL